MKSSSIKRILEECKNKLGIEEEVRVKLRNYRSRSAFIDLKTRTIYINKNLIDLGEEVVEYLILHELIHLKLGTKLHTADFYSELYNFIPPERLIELRSKVNRKMVDKFNQSNQPHKE
jgi:predicted metal-dependent hydrolase